MDAGIWFHAHRNGTQNFGRAPKRIQQSSIGHCLGHERADGEESSDLHFQKIGSHVPLGRGVKGNGEKALAALPMKKHRLAFKIFFLVTGLAVSLFILWAGKKKPDSSERVLAVGLKNGMSQTKPLSPFQKSKLEKHFLETPPRAHQLSLPDQSGALGVIGDVQKINEFN